MTVEESGGTLFSSPLFGDVLMYLYIIPFQIKKLKNSRGPFGSKGVCYTLHNMPRKNKALPHQPYQRRSSCDTKRRYKTEQEATKIAEYQMLLHPDLELSVYHCQDCGGWHLTRQHR